MIQNVRALAIFAKVAETGSFRTAARSLGLSPSVVSQQLSALEERLGVALLYRSTRALSLTPDGEALLASAQAMVAEAEKGLSRFAGHAAEPVGELRIAAPEVMALSPFAEAVALFSRAQPGVTLRISFTDERLDLVREGFDLAIRVGWLDDSALKARKIMEVPRVLVASSSMVRSNGMPMTPDDLAGWDLVVFSQYRSTQSLHQSGRPPVRLEGIKRIIASSAIGVYRLMLEGAGAATTLAFLVADDIARGDLVELLPDWKPKPAGLYAVWPPNVPRTGLTMRFIDHLERHMRKRL